MFRLRNCFRLRTFAVLFVTCLIVLLVHENNVGSKRDNILNVHNYSVSVGVSTFSGNVCDRDIYKSRSDFEGFSNITGDPYNCTIIPNYVHFVKFKQNTFSFPHTVCILAALKHQNPDKIFIHTDVASFTGKYWDVLQATPGFKEKLVISYTPMPREIYGQHLNRYWLPMHGGDVTRLRVLMRYGGIYLDNDSYIIKSLDFFRRFEISLGWKPGKALGNMCIVAHKNARFLNEWLESYNGNYKSNKFFYNAGEYPAQQILKKKPYLVHREESLFGNYGPFKNLYLKPFPEWRNYYAIHTLSSHLHELKGKSPNLTYPVKFTENNIMQYPVAYRDMVLSVFPNELIVNATS